ncbi:hypothetical protein Y032_0030g2212 [Ancylostoma ceylanicum]|uniref:Uncharacterized protein n=1 Tax=Ancylostoma ceylanicum TaxID=53326 RepID=A0A016UT70_9BILA|nr:hypothetical protein Y032_0030g2212 [Ancylostoma ceylanicum]
MLSLYLLIFVAVSLSTADYLEGGKPQAECDEPVKFTKDKSDAFIKKINEHRRLMVEGKQKNGKSNGNLPKGENVLEMRLSQPISVIFT